MRQTKRSDSIQRHSDDFKFRVHTDGVLVKTRRNRVCRYESTFVAARSTGHNKRTVACACPVPARLLFGPLCRLALAARMATGATCSFRCKGRDLSKS